MRVIGGVESNNQGCAAVVTVAMVMVMVMLMMPSAAVSYRLDTLEELSELLQEKEDSSNTRNTEVWRHELPLLVTLLKSIDKWEKQTSEDKDLDQQKDSGQPSKRGRDTVYGAMPPMRELCRMMGYASCPH